MRVAVFNGPTRPITIEQVAVPDPGPGELLVKVGRCGICGSDLSMTSDSPFAYPTGTCLGHEYAGEVVEVGREVTDVRAGDRVACIPMTGCGHCHSCRRGQFIHCDSAQPLFGGFGDYVAVPRTNAIRLPHSLSLSDGALVEPMACGLHALGMAGKAGGERILVLGAGSMAVAAIYWARVLGAGSITVASRSAHRHEVVRAMGADQVHSFWDDDPETLAVKLGGAPDLVIECVGTRGMLKTAVEQVRKGGTVLSMGMCMQEEPILPIVCAFKEVTIRFPVAYSLEEFVTTAEQFERGHVKPDLMVGEVIPLQALPATLEAMRSGTKHLKVHVDPTLESENAR